MYIVSKWLELDISHVLIKKALKKFSYIFIFLPFTKKCFFHFRKSLPLLLNCYYKSF